MWQWFLRTLGPFQRQAAGGRAEALSISEEELVRRAQQGDSSAMSEIYEANVEAVYRFIAFKVGDRREAEDLTHDVFLKVIESIGSFQWRDITLRAWVFRIAHNLIVDTLRRRSRRPTVALDDELPLPAPDDPAAEAELKVTMEQVTEAMSQLTDAQRQAVTLRFSADMSIEEVAQVMKKKPGAIKALQHSGLASLRRLLRGEGKE
ncbi:MAG: sigma-70 family RNA polymerase sigma factor [Chloroflexi bacterium]|nr:sigma-70 family RNA polymerase sigma factor [Chloroflexota bacterium]